MLSLGPTFELQIRWQKLHLFSLFFSLASGYQQVLSHADKKAKRIASRLCGPCPTHAMAIDDVPSIAVPGQILGPVSRYIAGSGTHVYQGNIASSLLGKVSINAPAKAPGPAKRLNKITAPAPGDLATISVVRHGRKREVLPDVNNVVLARVVRLMPKQAIVVIQQVGDTVLQTEWQGVIRVQDVRATEKDKVKMHESFKPGDIVRAQVVSRVVYLAEKTIITWTLADCLALYRRYLSEISPTTTSRRLLMNWVLSWPRARLAMTWCLSAGRSARIRRRALASSEKLPNRTDESSLIHVPPLSVADPAAGIEIVDDGKASDGSEERCRCGMGDVAR